VSGLVKKLNVAVLCDGETSACTINMGGIKKYSKHDLTIYQWCLPVDKTGDYDLVFVHYGGLLRDDGDKQNVIMQQLNKKECKWVAGILGPRNFNRWIKPRTNRKEFCEFVFDLDAITVSNIEYKRMVEERTTKIPTYITPCGVDLTIFKPSPPPEEFCVGTCDDRLYFRELPFEKKVARGYYPHGKKMPEFYKSISVYVETMSRPLPCGLCLLEAAACSRPIVAVEMGMLTNWIPPKMLRKKWEELVPLIEKLRDNKEFYGEQSRKFRKLAEEKWSYDVVVKDYDYMFEEAYKN